MSQRSQMARNGPRHALFGWPVGLERLALPGIVVLAVVLRLYGIATESIWLDEATSLMLARMDVPSLIKWTASDIHPPLYYLLLHFWIALGDSETAVRSLSLLASVLNVVVLYALGSALFGRRAGLYAALLLAADPFHIWYAQEARMYAWLALFVTLSILMALRVWRGARWLDTLGYVLATAAALYTHYYAVFAVLLANLFFLYLLLRRRLSRRVIYSWLGAQVAWFILFLPWFPIFLLPITVGGGGWVTLGLGRPSMAVWGQTIVLYMVGTGRAALPLLLRRAGYVLFAGAFALGLWPRGNPKNLADSGARDSGPLPFDEREAMFFSLAYLALPLGIAWGASQVFKPMYSIRYMLPFLIPFILIVARGVGNVPTAVGRAAVLLSLLGVMGLAATAQVQVADKPDWRDWSARLIERSRPGDVLLFVPGWHAKPFDYYARGALDYYEEVPVPVDQDRAWSLRTVDEAIAGHPRVWLIWETDHYTDPQGTVYHYLAERLRLVSEEELPLVGRVILFETPSP